MREGNKVSIKLQFSKKVTHQRQIPLDFRIILFFLFRVAIILNIFLVLTCSNQRISLELLLTNLKTQNPTFPFCKPENVLIYLQLLSSTQNVPP